MTNNLILGKKLNWAGEHWVNYIRPTGESSNSAMVSLYHTRWSPAGSGNVAWVEIPGEDGYKALCTDNPNLADYAVSHIVKGASSPPYGQDLPPVKARFSEAGDIRLNPSWTIDTGDHVIFATWTKILPVIIANGPWPDPPTISYVFSLLHFAESASIALDGHNIEGSSYLTDIWRPTIGDDRSSCVFALSETFMGETEE